MCKRGVWKKLIANQCMFGICSKKDCDVWAGRTGIKIDAALGVCALRLSLPDTILSQKSRRTGHVAGVGFKIRGVGLDVRSKSPVQLPHGLCLARSDIKHPPQHTHTFSIFHSNIFLSQNNRKPTTCVLLVFQKSKTMIDVRLPPVSPLLAAP
jgi:hypothetical protein